MSKTLLGVTVLTVVYTVVSTIALAISVFWYHDELKIIFALALCAGLGLMLSLFLIAECIHKARENHEEHKNDPPYKYP